MYRKILMFAIGLGALAAPLALTAPASADTGPSLGCQVISDHSGISGGFSTGICGTDVADSSYVIDLGVANGHDFYNWFRPGLTVLGGCNSTSPFCDLLVHARPAQPVPVRARVTAGYGPTSGTCGARWPAARRSIWTGSPR
jgi:hypothetical protein